MKLSAFTDRKLVNLDVASGTKEEVIGRMTELLSRSKKVTDADAFLQDVLAREELVSTGVGHGVAFPHAKSKAARSGARQKTLSSGPWTGIPSGSSSSLGRQRSRNRRACTSI